MADNTASSLAGLDKALTTSSSSSTAKPKKAGDSQISGTEFLGLLVEQLKNQDPLNPMDNQQFAVQLSQFSSLEQLISINDKVGQKEEPDSFSSLASYLGQEVVTNSQSVSLNGRDAPSVSFNLPSDAAGVKVELVNAAGEVKASQTSGPLAAGRHAVLMDTKGVENGEYKIKITSNKTTGGTQEIAGYSSGIVSGFIPGATPKLLVNGKEIGTADIKEVHAVQQ